MVASGIGYMARCTAPVKGHRTASAAADCPACGGRYGRYSGYSSYGSYSSPTSYSSGGSGGGRSSGGASVISGRPRWSGASSSMVYTPAEVRALTPVRESVEKRAALSDLRDVYILLKLPRTDEWVLSGYGRVSRERSGEQQGGGSGKSHLWPCAAEYLMVGQCPQLGR